MKAARQRCVRVRTARGLKQPTKKKGTCRKFVFASVRAGGLKQRIKFNDVAGQLGLHPYGTIQAVKEPLLPRFENAVMFVKHVSLEQFLALGGGLACKSSVIYITTSQGRCIDPL